ncbi:MAG: YHS domain-containing (seleno)protein [Beijerinckiaceae bacterium]
MANQFMKLGNGIFTACLMAGIIFSTASANPLLPRVEQHVIADPQSGLALFGFDPVTYHVENAARLGLKGHELYHKNLLWRFRSAANLEAFRADPSAYIPAFGGNDGFSVSQGMMASGDPETFVIASGTLVFFRSPDNRDRFATDSDVRRKAEISWPDVVRQHAAH